MYKIRSFRYNKNEFIFIRLHRNQCVRKIDIQQFSDDYFVHSDKLDKNYDYLLLLCYKLFGIKKSKVLPMRLVRLYGLKKYNYHIL